MSLVSFTGSYTKDEPIFSFLEMRYMEGFLIGLIYDVSLWSRLIDDHDIHHWLLTPVLSACMRRNVPFTM